MGEIFACGNGARYTPGMSTLQEIKTAIARLNPHDKAVLAAELFAMDAEPDAAELETSLQRGLCDVEAGRVRPIEEVKDLLPQWASKS
jgi:hypothetical protein